MLRVKHPGARVLLNCVWQFSGVHWVPGIKLGSAPCKDAHLDCGCSSSANAHESNFTELYFLNQREIVPKLFMTRLQEYNLASPLPLPLYSSHRQYPSSWGQHKWTAWCQEGMKSLSRSSSVILTTLADTQQKAWARLLFHL